MFTLDLDNIESSETRSTSTLLSILSFYVTVLFYSVFLVLFLFFVFQVAKTKWPKHFVTAVSWIKLGNNYSMVMKIQNL